MIVIEDYNPTWPLAFETLRQVYLNALQGIEADIEHVGSTSIPNLAAKPVLDIDIAVSNFERLPEIIERLSVLGYDHRGNLGIEGREAFKINIEKAQDSIKNAMAHHLYVCLRDSDAFKNHVTIRNFLKQNPQKMAEYAALKRHIAKQAGMNKDFYTTSKTAFLLAILKETGFDEAVLEKIAVQNGLK
jgi:GrpB-like predicted nucleotidyltransferase (UPF0157 family)